ncbi:MAG: cysteine--tRNA ligase [Candidatus Komeilibacteria bacterium CG11_big_fil_rev_8_21_14_0_20_36_20]|uniref:Cysteine--tRNA ligase n=1 Tax=Candidatus Komeilibacteria bacterium CG11_big_fil_rev_8_21_14_0_20_36_20 TaxID=1974477 RepID=A0A2H0NGA7_9BACT|nr:MAG: cysteine--tRNA ligase [Candidatus Komeilibacteria bacterium CG11_big_fil_rev_8_21_14_0_20_36_20]PIR81650.1 MAG: cysteine--tRNA ligase [Candidatus Komeilibacteria bacterium CG10_big_fil_rev_8_21_14_0_10_36_65]PJC55582.1 MAG: cysteine--tRNA ligase [Candidatus Komeilibacteria bacterium CG_4_9_14_0_2_um_filter_36_13]
MKILLYNSLTKQKEEFKPIEKNKVGLYTCGPTVYDYPHIGNLLAYIFWDVLKRFFLSQGYKVKHVMNLTDVGHLVSDADEGEDKLAKAGRESGRTAWQVADFFIKVFKRNIKDLNILKPTHFLRATETIQEQIDFVSVLEEKGFLYQTSDGLYFDTSKLPDYGKLANLSQIKLQEGARVAKNPEKKNPTDFAVWKFSPKDGRKRDMEWDSPWGVGFPGWHLECSVMSQMMLGDTFDIHTGGIDHLTVHHPNEMAQSEAATGKLQANYWLHNAFNKVDGHKMAKSAGNFIILEDIKKKGYWPLAYRLLVLQNHYRQPLNFTWLALEAAQQSLKNIIREIAFYDEPKKVIAEFAEKFDAALADDLNTAKGLAVLQAVIDSDKPTADKLATILKIDEVLGLNLKEFRKNFLSLSSQAKKLLKQRSAAREKKDWDLSDDLREQLNKIGVEVQDTTQGQKAVQMK